MKALQYTAIGRPPEIREVPTPEPRPGEVLVRTTAAGVCHSDQYTMDRTAEDYAFGFPLTLGHEGAGIVAGLGAGAANGGVKEGDAVAVYGAWGCGYCRACATGAENYCLNADAMKIGWPGFEGKVFYVWFDAPIEYIGATKEWADLDPEHRSWRSWWFDAGDVRYTEFLGKDNIPFHTINFPITIMGSGEPWKLVDYVKGFNYLTYYGGKFSTSQQRGVFMDTAIDLLPADYWRYALLASAPESDDTEFTWESFALTVNKDLAGIFGNFVQRTLKLTEKLFGMTVPAGGEPGPEEAELAASLDAALLTFAAEMDAMRFRPAAFALRSLWTLGNQYLDRCAPWHETDTARVACILRTAINVARLEAIVSAPFVPFACDRLAASLGLEAVERSWPGPAAEELLRLGPGRGLHMGEPLFPRIGDRSTLAGWVAEMEQRFGGPP